MNCGRRRAASRVKQRHLADQKRWTTSGKLQHPRHKQSQLSNKPKHSASSQQLWHNRPWNERFIYDENSVEANCVGRPHTQSQPACVIDGKENNVIEDSVGGLRGYTERSDGEVVKEFTRCEISPSSPVAHDKHSDLIGTRNTGVSPFDLEKVRAALEADATDSSPHVDDNDEQPRHKTESNDSKQSALQGPSLLKEDQALSRNIITKKKTPLITMPLDQANVSAILDQCEDLLYTIELEEELLLRDIARIPSIQTTTFLPDMNYGINEEVINGETYAEPRISKERQNVIADYADSLRSFKYQQEKCITKNGHLSYSDIVQVLADNIVNECITDVAEEIEQCIGDISEVVFQQI